MIAFIPTENIFKLKKFIDKANKKAVKLGLEGFVFNLTGNIKVEKVEVETSVFDRYVEYTELEITGSTPQFSGWKLISKIDFIEGIGSISNTVPSEVLPTKYHDHDNVCQHCGHKRHRNANVIIQNVESLEYKSVGSSCLKLFLGGKTAEAILWYASILKQFDEIEEKEEFCGISTGEYICEIKNVLQLASSSIKKFGWVSGSKAYEEGGYSTASTVKDFMFWPKVDFTLPITPVDIELVDKVVDYFVNVDPDNNEYIVNLQTFTKSGFVNPKGFGYVCSMIIAYKIATEIKEVKENKTNEFVGSVKEKIELELKYVKGFSFEGYYGVTNLEIFESPEGNTFTWMTSKYNEIEEGTIYKVKGTIKEHKEYNGTNQTVLTRCKIKEIENK